MSHHGTRAGGLSDALHHSAHLSVSSLASTRRLLARWAAAAGLDSETAHAVVLSGYEALANVVEHAYGVTDGGVVELHATWVDREVTVVVVDHGRWQIPSSSPWCRGRCSTRRRGW